jgi:hypothetical protein
MSTTTDTVIHPNLGPLPWRVDTTEPMHVLDARNRHVVSVWKRATVEPVNEVPDIAQAIAALPDLIAAGRALMDAMDAMWGDTPMEPVGEEGAAGWMIEGARSQMRQALRRASGLMPDGTIPPLGTSP